MWMGISSEKIRQGELELHSIARINDTNINIFIEYGDSGFGGRRPSSGQAVFAWAEGYCHCYGGALYGDVPYRIR